MRIRSIYIKNVQAVEEPLIINLDKYITRIYGPNASGKSLIIKSMLLFSGIYSKDEIKALIPKKLRNKKLVKAEDLPVVALFLEDFTTIWATINMKEKVKFIRKDINDNIIQVWEEHSQEISDLIGYKVVDSAEMVLNVKKSGNNLFLDTKSTTNSEVVEYICQDENIEKRLNNLEEYEKSLQTHKKAINSYLDYYKKKIKDEKYIDIEQLRLLYESLNNTVYKEDVALYLKNSIEVVRGRITLQEINTTLKELNNSVQILNNIQKLKNLVYLTKEKLTLEGTGKKLGKVLQINKECKHIYLAEKLNVDKNNYMIWLNKSILAKKTKDMFKDQAYKSKCILLKDSYLEYQSVSKYNAELCKYKDIIGSICSVNNKVEQLQRCITLKDKKKFINKLQSIRLSTVSNYIYDDIALKDMVLCRTEIVKYIKIKQLVGIMALNQSRQKLNSDIKSINTSRKDLIKLSTLNEALNKLKLLNEIRSSICNIAEDKKELVVLKEAGKYIDICPLCYQSIDNKGKEVI